MSLGASFVWIRGASKIFPKQLSQKTAKTAKKQGKKRCTQRADKML
jgi:hypothetical protein